MQGFIYVWGGAGGYKVGRAKDPRKRAKDFFLMPFKCDFALEHPTENAVRAESYLHRFFRDKHLNGEWFRLSEDDIQDIPDIIRRLDNPEPPVVYKFQGVVNTEGASMYVTLKSYLERLQEVEGGKPKGQRREIPTLGEIAGEVGITPTALSNIAQNNIKQMSLETGGKIIAAVRARGFRMEVSDLLGYRSPDEE